MKSLLAAFAALCVGLSGGFAFAQFSSGVQPVFTTPPTSTMGTILNPNALVVTPLPNGFSVSGQLQISIPAGPVSGVLATWTVERRVDSPYGAAGLTTNTVLTGFSTPPVGTVGNSSGSVSSTWRTVPGYGLVGGSTSTVPMTLVNGVDSPAWNSLFATSVPFTYNSFVSPAVMQQVFTLNGNYTSGAGGIWTVDVPVTSVVVPEPACVSATVLGFGLFTRGRRSSRL